MMERAAVEMWHLACLREERVRKYLGNVLVKVTGPNSVLTYPTQLDSHQRGIIGLSQDRIWATGFPAGKHSL